jgi:hypothetical protein
MTDYIRTPFALNGDQSVVPQTDGSGAVNFDQGYPIKYSQDPNTTGLSLDRANMNYLFWLLSQAVQQYQQHGFPDFITSVQNGGVPFPYAKDAVVLFGGVLYQSKIVANTTTPPSANWVAIDPYNQLIANASPIFTGNPEAPTQPPNTNDDTLATTAYADAAAAAVVTGEPKVVAQVVFDGDGGVVIKSSYNIASVVRNSTGLYTINFAAALANADYAVQISNLTEFGGNNGSIYSTTGGSGVPAVKTTAALQICVGNGSNRNDNGYLSVTIFGA